MQPRQREREGWRSFACTRCVATKASTAPQPLATVSAAHGPLHSAELKYAFTCLCLAFPSSSSLQHVSARFSLEMSVTTDALASHYSQDGQENVPASPSPARCSAGDTGIAAPWVQHKDAHREKHSSKTPVRQRCRCCQRSTWWLGSQEARWPGWASEPASAAQSQPYLLTHSTSVKAVACAVCDAAPGGFGEPIAGQTLTEGRGAVGRSGLVRELGHVRRCMIEHRVSVCHSRGRPATCDAPPRRRIAFPWDRTAPILRLSVGPDGAHGQHSTRTTPQTISSRTTPPESHLS